MIYAMTRELTHQLERLGQERQRLEVLLSRQPDWLDWKQLSEVPEPADESGRYDLARRKTELERELLRDPLFSAHCSIMAAIRVIEDLIAQRSAVEAHLEQADDGGTPPAIDLEVGGALSESINEPGDNPPDDAAPVPQDVSPQCRPHDLPAIALADLRGSRVVMQAVTIHDAPPGQKRNAATLADADAPPDRLTRIRRIDKDLAAALIARGVRHFAQIAAFGPADVRALSAALGLGRRISQENWIEQAAILATKSATCEIPACDVLPQASQPDTALDTSEMVREAALRIAAAIQASRNDQALSAGPSVEVENATAGDEPRSKPAAPDDLELLTGIDETIAEILRAEGVMRFDEIAKWSAAAVAHFQERVGADISISRLGWIEQAALLSCGGMTAHALRKARGEFAALALRPTGPAVRNEAFAAWLTAHTRSHAPTEAPLEARASQEFREPLSVGQAHADTETPPTVADLEVMPFEEFETGTEIAESDAHMRSAVLEPEPLAESDQSTAEIIPLRCVVEIEANDFDLPAEIGAPAIDRLDDDELVEEGTAAAPVGVPSIQPDTAVAEAAGDATRAAIEADEPTEPKPPATAAQPVRPVNIADRITAIERDAAELAGVSRQVLERLKQGGQQNRAGKVDTKRQSQGANFSDDRDTGEDLAEVDVRIVRRETDAAGQNMPREPYRDALGRRAADASFEGNDYAAYCECVEEASVEIVPVADVASGEIAPPTAADRAAAGRSEKRVGQEAEVGKVRRFLRALRGA